MKMISRMMGMCERVGNVWVTGKGGQKYKKGFVHHWNFSVAASSWEYFYTNDCLLAFSACKRILGFEVHYRWTQQRVSCDNRGLQGGTSLLKQCFLHQSLSAILVHWYWYGFYWFLVCFTLVVWANFGEEQNCFIVNWNTSVSPDAEVTGPLHNPQSASTQCKPEVLRLPRIPFWV